jgi:hypothetical protein
MIINIIVNLEVIVYFMNTKFYLLFGYTWISTRMIELTYKFKQYQKLSDKRSPIQNLQKMQVIFRIVRFSG